MNFFKTQNVRLAHFFFPSFTNLNWSKQFSQQMSTNSKLLVFCGPSGSGKSTLLKRLIGEYPDRLGFSVSHTTRKPRDGELNGVHYHFVDANKMQEEIANGKFIEYATFSGNMYGTSKMAVENVCKQDKICVLDIDVQGVVQVKSSSSLQPWYVFVKPPSIQSLEHRLKARKSETAESLMKRLEVAAKEITYGEIPGNFDIVIVNDKLENAYNELKQFVKVNVFEDDKE